MPTAASLSEAAVDAIRASLHARMRCSASLFTSDLQNRSGFQIDAKGRQVKAGF